MKNPLFAKIETEIAKYEMPKNRVNYQRFFKEKLKYPEGLKSNFLKRISNTCFKEIQRLPKVEILSICDQLFVLDRRYYRYFATEWALKIKDQLIKSDFELFATWLKKYVDNWGICDVLGGGPIGTLVDRYPELFAETSKWSTSTNRWLRRAAAVCLIPAVQNNRQLENVFEMANRLLKDPDDMVQKGYG